MVAETTFPDSYSSQRSYLNSETRTRNTENDGIGAKKHKFNDKLAVMVLLNENYHEELLQAGRLSRQSMSRGNRGRVGKTSLRLN